MRCRRLAFALALSAGLFAAVHDLLMQPPRFRTDLAALGEPPFAIAMAVVGALGVALFVRKRREVLGASIVFATITLAAYVDAARIGAFGEHHAKHLPAIALAGWLGAHVVRRRALAWDAAAGAVGAAYCISGLSKVWASGWSFVESGALALLVAERAEPGTWLGGLREGLSGSPVLISALAVATLAVELSGPLMIWPRLRPFFAAAATVMHVGIALALGYVYFPWVLTVVAVAIPVSPESERLPQAFDT